MIQFDTYFSDGPKPPTSFVFFFRDGSRDWFIKKGIILSFLDLNMKYWLFLIGKTVCSSSTFEFRFYKVDSKTTILDDLERSNMIELRLVLFFVHARR